MAQEKYGISSKARFNLLRMIEYHLGLIVKTKSDCKILSNVVLAYSDKYLSESTLYRLLLKPEPKHKPNLDTLNILAQFCRFSDWFQFEQYAGNYFLCNNNSAQQNYWNEHTYAFLRACIHQNNLRPVAEFFDQDFSQVDAFTQDRMLGFELFKILAENPNSNMDFYSSFYQHPALRRIFFEHNTDPDCRIKQHMHGMELYRSASNYEDGIDGLQDYIFAMCLLLRYNFKIENYPKVLELGKTLYECEAFDKAIESLIFYPRLRYHAYKLLYFKAQNNKIKCREQEEYMLDYYRHFVQSLKDGHMFYKSKQKDLIHKNRLQNQSTAALSIFGEAMILAGTSIPTKKNLLKIAYQKDNPLFEDFEKKSLERILPSMEINVPYVYSQF